MRLRGRQARFLTIILCLWTLGRGIGHWSTLGSGSAIAEDVSMVRTVVRGDDGLPAPIAGRIADAVLPKQDRTIAGGRAIPATQARRLPMLRLASDRRPAHQITGRIASTSPPSLPGGADLPADGAPAIADLVRAPRTVAGRPWTLDGYVFLRPGSGRAALSPTGQLGGSQVAARATYRVATIGPVAIAAAARIYAPLQGPGAEAAAGIDLRLQGAVPMRLSIERRQRIDAAGRSAWSAYVAGGVYREAGGVVLDAYGQAGVVGLHRKDVFVDGALRAGGKIGGRLILGGAAWGAAQPGVSRLDVGPRAAWRLPIADHALTLAIEGRFRVAGQARPGSGAAMTLAADF